MTGAKRLIEVDEKTAVTLETRASERGMSVPDLVAEMTARSALLVLSPAEEIAELDRQWAAIVGGEPTVAHVDVVRWLQTWGTPAFEPWVNR